MNLFNDTENLSLSLRDEIYKLRVLNDYSKEALKDDEVD